MHTFSWFPLETQSRAEQETIQALTRTLSFLMDVNWLNITMPERLQNTSMELVIFALKCRLGKFCRISKMPRLDMQHNSCRIFTEIDVENRHFENVPVAISADEKNRSIHAFFTDKDINTASVIFSTEKIYVAQDIFQIIQENLYMACTLFICLCAAQQLFKDMPEIFSQLAAVIRQVQPFILPQ